MLDAHLRRLLRDLQLRWNEEGVAAELLPYQMLSDAPHEGGQSIVYWARLRERWRSSFRCQTVATERSLHRSTLAYFGVSDRRARNRRNIPAITFCVLPRFPLARC
jgi:hypothetical protein